MKSTRDRWYSTQSDTAWMRLGAGVGLGLGVVLMFVLMFMWAMGRVIVGNVLLLLLLPVLLLSLLAETNNLDPPKCSPELLHTTSS